MPAEAPHLIAGVALPVHRLKTPDNWFSRLWLAMPAWWGQAAGAAAMLAWLSFEVPAYFTSFWTMGAWFQFADGTRFDFPWTRVLVDLNILLVALAFIFRRPAKIRSARPSDVLLALIGGWWPMLPFLAVATIAWFDPLMAAEWKAFVQSSRLTFLQVAGGALLVLIGNALDLSGYSTLFRSFSVVPEARDLKTTGLYRLVRHPVYLGQFISQAGIWLVFAPDHWVWWSYYAMFVVLQLWRARREEQILEQAFGNTFLDWKERTFWFA